MTRFTSFRGQFSALIVLAPLACAGNATRHAPPVPAAAANGGSGSCERARIRAESLLDGGRPWSARRALEGCEAQAQPLLARASEALGEQRRAKASSAQPAAEGLEAVEKRLGAGDCAGALAAAEALYQASVPSPQAAVLAGQASACLRREADATRWYARAHFEAELVGAPSGWRLPEIPKAVSWRGSSRLSLRTAAGAASLSDPSDQGHWVMQSLTSPLLAEPWLVGNVQISLEQDAIFGKEAAGKVVWRRPLGPLSAVSPAFADGQALVLDRVGNTFQIGYERLDLATGRVLSSGKVQGIEPRAVVSAPFASWFSFETPAPDGRDITVVVVDRGGKVQRRSVDEGCRPLAAWSATELLSDCGDRRALFAVDVESAQRRKLADKPAHSFTFVTTLAEGLVSLSGAGGVLLLRKTGSSATLTAPPELTGFDWRSVSWSPDRTRVAALGRQGEREQLVVYGRGQQPVQVRWTAYLQPRRPIGFALSRDRWKLALGICPELTSFDLRTGAFTAKPLEECSPRLEPSGQDDFAVVKAPSTDPLITLSPDGKLVLTQTRSEQNGVVRRTLMLAPASAGASSAAPAIWQTPIQRDAKVLFSRDGRTLYFLLRELVPSSVPVWQELDVASLRVQPSARSAELDGAVELAEDGTLLTTRTLSKPGAERSLAHASWSDPDVARSDGLSFAARDRLVVGRRDGEAWLWQASDGALLGRLLPLASGGALFTKAPPQDHRSRQPQTATAQLFGAVAHEGVVCVIADRQYDWEVCADRYGDEELFARTLSAAMK